MKPINLLPRRASLAGLRLTSLALLIGCLPVACSKKSDATPQATCKLTSSTYQAGGNSSTETREYTTDGQLKSIASSDGHKTSLIFDGTGYLTTATNLSSNGSVFSTTQFEFTNGRLTKATTKNSTGAITSTTQYDYDGAGELSRYVEQNVGSNTYTSTYTGGKQTGYVIRSSAGVESQPYTFEDGLVKRYTSGTSQYTCAYDAQRRRTRYETYSSGKLTSYTVYEYIDGTTADLAQGSYKGISELIVYGGNRTGLNTGLETKSTYYTVSSTNVTTKYSETTTTYTKNASGFPTEANLVYSEYTATGAVSYTTTYKYTYQYTDCQ